jgi:hypothetical protein
MVGMGAKRLSGCDDDGGGGDGVFEPSDEFIKLPVSLLLVLDVSEHCREPLNFLLLVLAFVDDDDDDDSLERRLMIE